MALFQVSEKQLVPVKASSLSEEGVMERQHLQQWLIGAPEALGEELFILTEEYGDWSDSKRRIDLLALDKDANLVVIELKRTEDGGHMDLQAIRYAAMVSSMTYEDAVAAHQAFLVRQGSEQSAREAIATFLGVPGDTPQELTSVPRIVLVASGFSVEITTTVLWLMERGVDIRCVQVTPYRIGEPLFVELRQILPLEEASEYQVKIRQKDQNVRLAASTGKNREGTMSVLTRIGAIEVGTVIEVVPKALAAGAGNRIANLYRAKIVDLEARESIEWLHDGQRYSVSRLTQLLWEQHGVTKLRNNVFVHWRVVDETRSMWDHAEEETRGERMVGSGG